MQMNNRFKYKYEVPNKQGQVAKNCIFYNYGKKVKCCFVPNLNEAKKPTDMIIIENSKCIVTEGAYCDKFK